MEYQIAVQHVADSDQKLHIADVAVAVTANLAFAAVVGAAATDIDVAVEVTGVDAYAAAAAAE